VEHDVEYAASLGINGTPTFFVNGRPYKGAQSLETFVAIIDDELARVRMEK
jgi:protein-disulfide isomerase